MQPNTNNTNKPPRNLMKNSKLIVAIAVVAVIGGVLLLRLEGVRLRSTNKYNYQSSAQSAPTATVGSLSFEKPAEFKETHNDKKTDGATTTYAHTNDKGYTIAYIGASSSKNPLASNGQYIAGVKYLMSHAEGKDYDQYVGHFQDFVKSFSGPAYTVVLSKPRPFTSSNIKANAWVFDVTATAQGAKGFSPLQGQFIFAAGSKSFNYFSIMTLASNWSSNSAAVNQINNSIKIDQ
jgi:hypothetical protein